MNNRNNSNYSGGRFFKDILITSAVAAFCGFVVGLLVAPQTGRNFRNMIFEKTKEIIDRSRFAVIEARVKTEELLEKGKEKVEEVSAKLTGGKEAD